MRKPLIVGHSPNLKTGLVVEPLDPAKPGAGKRLLAMSGLDEATFRDGFDRVNVSPTGPKPQRVMAELATRMKWSGLMDSRKVIIVGKATFNLFRWRLAPDCPMTWAWEPYMRMRLAWIPHTSGLSRFWNDPAQRDRLATFMRGAVYHQG